MLGLDLQKLFALAESLLLPSATGDMRTEADRSRERHRRILLSTIGAGGAKGISIITMLVTVPVALHYLGPERYGLLMTVMSLLAVVSFADFGLGNGLLNAVTEATGPGDQERLARAVSSAFFMLLGVAVGLAGVLALAYPVVPWKAIFNVSSAPAIAESGPAVLAFMACFLVSLPLGIVQRVQMGFQEGYWNSLWTAAGSLLGVAAMLLAVYAGLGLPWLVLALAGAPVVAAMANGVHLLGVQRRELLPRWGLASAVVARGIAGTGFLFFILQLSTAVAFASDNLIVAQVLGASSVSTYSVAQRLFGLSSMLLGFMLVPLWPAYGEALATGDHRWIRRTLRRSVIASIVVTGSASLVLCAFGKVLVNLWVGPTLTPTWALLFGFAAWTVLAGVGNAIAMFLNGIGVLRLQVTCAIALAIVSILAKIYSARAFGLNGVIWAMVISYFFCTLVPIYCFLPRMISSLGTVSEIPAEGTASGQPYDTRAH